jgi:hypothetical protein
MTEDPEDHRGDVRLDLGILRRPDYAGGNSHRRCGAMGFYQDAIAPAVFRVDKRVWHIHTVSRKRVLKESVTRVCRSNISQPCSRTRSPLPSDIPASAMGSGSKLITTMAQARLCRL